MLLAERIEERAADSHPSDVVRRVGEYTAGGQPVFSGPPASADGLARVFFDECHRLAPEFGLVASTVSFDELPLNERLLLGAALAATTPGSRERDRA